MNIEHTATLLEMIGALYPNFRPSEHTTAGWHMVLEPVTLESAIHALKTYARKGGAFAPSAGELYQTASAVICGRLPVPTADELRIMNTDPGGDRALRLTQARLRAKFEGNTKTFPTPSETKGLENLT